MRPKVVHLTSVHPPFDSRIYFKECRSLAQEGYHVVLIAPYDREAVPESEMIQLRAVRRPKSRLTRMTWTAAAVLLAALRERADIYHFHDPELITIGTLLKITGSKVIYDVHEDLPNQILTKTWITPVLRGPVSVAANAAETIASVLFDAIVVANPAVVARFAERKTVLVQSFPIWSEFDCLAPEPYAGRGYKAAYVGGITELRGIKEMISAVDQLRHWPGLRLSLAGLFGPPELERSVATWSGADLVDWKGFLSRQQVSEMLRQVRVGLVLLHPTSHYRKIQPTKLFEYMAAGIPIVASDIPAWRSIIDRAACGLTVNPMDPTEIASAIDWLLSHETEAAEMGRRGREFAQRHYNWDTEAERLCSLYKRVLSNQPSLETAAK